ncbi:MAG: class I SAM-dependent methyltransferase [Anaerolineae bacterium]|nr:MAG: class I SAM-dependent methyltransferase [Anaerolineae bacterium]
MTPYVSEFKWSVGKLYNGAFVSIDPELYYSMVRHYRPNLIIEIGSGHSTHFAADALQKNRAGRIISIDPEPRRTLPRGVEHIQARVEDVGRDIFANLHANDILFIDSSHTAEERVITASTFCPGCTPGLSCTTTTSPSRTTSTTVTTLHCSVSLMCCWTSTPPTARLLRSWSAHPTSDIGIPADTPADQVLPLEYPAHTRFPVGQKADVDR